MKALKYSLVALILITTLLGCKKTEEEIAPTLSINPAQKDIEANQGSFVIAVASTVKWTASSDKSWLTLNPVSGNGDATIQVDYQLNNSAANRTALITFKGINVEDKVLTVTQLGIQPILTVSPANLSVAADAGNAVINITSNLSWTVTSNQTWCTLAQSSGIGNASLTINFQPNTVQSQRSAIITFAANGVTNQTVQVTQAAFVPVLSVTPSNQTVNSPSGSAVFNVTSNISWTATCTESWCTLANPGGTNNGTLTVIYEENTTSGPRTATITVSGEGVASQSVTLTQTNLIPTLSVTPSNREVSSAAGSTTFNIASNSSWTAQSDQGWCTIQNETGTGNATLNVNYDGLPSGSERTAIISIDVIGLNTQTVIIIQKAEPVNVALASFGGVATAISSGTYNGLTHYPDFAIDGNSSTFWASQWDMPAWIKVEFNQVYSINSVGIWWSQHVHTFSVSLSLDGISWTTVVPYRLSTNTEGGIPVHELYEITPMNARYIKCEMTTTSAPSSHIFQATLGELEAFH